MDQILRYTAFPASPGGGNPAGIVLGADGLTPDAMQAIAADIDFPETAFVTDLDEHLRTATVCYFSPVAAVPFCGHATIATAVCLASRLGPGPFVFTTPVGPLDLTTRLEDGQLLAGFTSVEPRVGDLDPAVLDELLGLLGLTFADLSAEYPPREAFAGNLHPLIVLESKATFDTFVFDSPALRALMDREGWQGTVIVLWPAGPNHFEARNLFASGRYAEDPATGSAAAAVGAYLRELGLVVPPTSFTIAQGHHVGRPSLVHVDVPESGGITVWGTANSLPNT
ncbi:MAG: PhzF family phenazine biosynthesis protein [Propionibacteriaceae bacterium]|nr:PhzF family phenazine biosynthesis protein [Propionibacteriaceae bacterium]